ncbi:MAG: DsbA family oxidoreductase [Dechloromonas sp.]|jgi:predicted DsbA family dithiol-disulfide isomerase|nr:DsbA family oxidoreductase [Dechloromonas sp.]HRF31279.1 DsbA family oxidoreductase [Azonexus sp.]
MLTIEIVSDLVCPWCFIGLRRLSTAIEQVRREIPGFSCRKVWRPFFLNPDTPPQGEPYMPFLEAKFGSREAVEALFARVREAGRAYDLDYAFERITLRANTLQAHRLIHWAQQRGEAEQLVERLFVAQFQRGEYVGDVALLTQIAAECGYPPAEVAAYLASTQDVDTVRSQEAEGRAAGIRQVPTFIVDRRLVVVGAEDPAVLAEAMRQAWASS